MCVNNAISISFSKAVQLTKNIRFSLLHSHHFSVPRFISYLGNTTFARPYLKAMVHTETAQPDRLFYSVSPFRILLPQSPTAN